MIAFYTNDITRPPNRLAATTAPVSLAGHSFRVVPYRSQCRATGNWTQVLQRRGNTFTSRLGVPADLRPLLGRVEITRSLRTGEIRPARPACVRHSAPAGRLPG
ncbi:DUF6538 domain-containing protein [Metallibacterium scheffleri]